ncbi:MAG: cyclic nucleotide-binding domain-containing protein [Candidatus Puniceispirillaceae bacterium]
MKVEDLANVFPTETMEAGTVLFEQGSSDGDGYIVQVGKVELSRRVGDAVQRGIFVEAGEIFGVYKTLFENDQRYFTGTVVEKSRITRIPEQVLKDRIAASDPFIIYCVRNWPNLGDRLIT